MPWLLGLNFLIFFLWAFWPQWLLGPIGPNMPIAKGQPQVVQVSLGPWAHPRDNHKWCRFHGGQLGAPEAMTQQPIAIGVWPVVVFFLSRCGGALVDGFELPALFCGHAGPSGVWPLGPTCPLPRDSHKWCRFLWALGPIAKGQPQGTAPQGY